MSAQAVSPFLRVPFQQHRSRSNLSPSLLTWLRVHFPYSGGCTGALRPVSSWFAVLIVPHTGFLFACFLYGSSLKFAKLNSSVVFPENDPLFLGNFLSSLAAQLVKNLPAMQETWARSLGQEDPLEKGKATHSGVLAWRIPWTEEPGGLQSMGLQRAGHD